MIVMIKNFKRYAIGQKHMKKSGLVRTMFILVALENILRAWYEAFLGHLLALSRILDFRISGNPEFRVSGIPEIRDSGNPVSGNP